MAESIVKIPSTAVQDFDFLAFSFNGKHSWDDFGIYRVSDGDRYNTELAPQMNDLTAENPAADGMFFFNSFHKQKVFNINFAFEEINDVTLRSLKQWLDGKEQGDLWFEEEPYKVYTAKVTGTPSIKHIPFDKYVGDTKTRVYRGEGTIQFTCYWPYAHTPDKIQRKNGSAWVDVGNGKDLDSYTLFTNKSLWSSASELTSSTGTCTGENPGDLPTPFILSKSGTTNANTTFTITDKLYIKTLTTVYGLKWDSKTGIVSGLSSAAAEESTRAPVLVEGNTVGGIPVGGCQPAINGATLTYHYWYY